MDFRRVFGNFGERHAEKFLKKEGYTIVERQYRSRFGEIDLIAKDGDEIIFVEVKARKGTEFGFPEESVTPAKLRKIERTGEIYMKQFSLDAPWRIDVISIIERKKEMQVVHLKSVY